jgi:hypothetical protein
VPCILTVHLEGIYLCLFLAAFPVLLRRIQYTNGPALVFFIGNTLIFVLVSANTGQSHGSPLIFSIRFLRRCSLIEILSHQPLSLCRSIRLPDGTRCPRPCIQQHDILGWLPTTHLCCHYLHNRGYSYGESGSFSDDSHSPSVR